MIAPNSWTKPPSGISLSRSSSDPTPPWASSYPASMGRRAHVRLDDALAPPRARLRRADRLFRSHDPRRSWKRPAQANSSRIGVFKRTSRPVRSTVWRSGTIWAAGSTSSASLSCRLCPNWSGAAGSQPENGSRPGFCRYYQNVSIRLAWELPLPPPLPPLTKAAVGARASGGPLSRRKGRVAHLPLTEMSHERPFAQARRSSGGSGGGFAAAAPARPGARATQAPSGAASRSRPDRVSCRCRRSFVLPTLPSLLKLQAAVQLGAVPCLTYTARLRVVRVRRRR